VKVSTRSYVPRLLDRALVGAGLFLALLLIGVQVARAAEIIPSIGVARAIDSDDDQARISGGLAFRAPILSIFKTEVGVQYRSENRLDDNLHIRQWPITGSLWLNPMPALYLGGGVGWYHTTYDYDDGLPVEDETTQDFGVHLGAGLEVPLGPSIGLDMNGRYVFLENVEDKLSTEEFDPDFWSTTVGLAFKF
jgi:hypothetical protein